MRDILLFGRRYFREFARDEHIATNILSDRLARLEATGLLDKRQDERQRNQFIYSPTEAGWNLLPVVIELLFWGATHDPYSPVSRDYAIRIPYEKEFLIQEISLAARAGTFTNYYHSVMGVPTDAH